MKTCQALLSPKAYPEKTSKVKVIETHISWVFLTDRFAYKLKRPVNLGFCDFSSPQKRHYYCEEELRLNQRLSPDLYLAVLPVKDDTKGIKIGGKGKTVDYVVKMKRLPEKSLMSWRLKKLSKKNMEEIGRIVAKFYQKAKTGPAINKFGSISAIKFNWQENFSQTRPFIDKTINKTQFQEIKKKIDGFLKNNKALFQKRVTEGRIREGHGDLHTGNIFLHKNKVYIFDCIEFNKRFRFQDAAGDIGFLSMDLEFKNRPGLSGAFVKEYIKNSGDKNIKDVLAFYKCYRAYVLGKVNNFKMENPQLTSREKRKIQKQAREYFKLAWQYAQSL